MKVIIFFVAVLFLSFSALYLITPPYLDPSFIGLTLFLDLLALALFVRLNLSTYKMNIFRHSVFFLLGFVIVHFQFITEYVIDPSLISTSDIWIDKTIVCRALLISSFGLLFFIIGFQTFLVTQLYPVNILSKRPAKIGKLNYPIVLVGLAYIIFILFLMYADTKYLLGFYGYVDAGPAGNRLQLFLGLLLSAVIIINSRIYKGDSKGLSFLTYIRTMGWAFNILVGVYVVLTMFIGDRGPGITIALIYISGYVFKVKTRPRPTIVILALIFGAGIMSVIGLYRSTNPDLPFSERIVTIFSEKVNNKSLAFTDELASSVRSLHYSVSKVPRRIDHKYGWFQVRQVLTAIPGFANILDINNPKFEEKDSPNLITYLDQGRYPTYGLGSTIVADFYIDLGLTGVIIGMFLFGYLLSRLEYYAYSDKPVGLFLFVLIMVFMSKSIYFSRSTALSAIQESVWVYIIVLLNANFLNLRLNLRKDNE